MPENAIAHLAILAICIKLRDEMTAVVASVCWRTPEFHIFITCCAPLPCRCVGRSYQSHHRT